MTFLPNSLYQFHNIIIPKHYLKNYPVLSFLDYIKDLYLIYFSSKLQRNIFLQFSDSNLLLYVT